MLLIEGEGQPAHRSDELEAEFTVEPALTVVSFDEQKGQYRWRVYTAEGQCRDAEARLLDGGALQWGFWDEERKVQFRFLIRQGEKGEWFEVGDISPNGTQWHQFLELRLVRQ